MKKFSVFAGILTFFLAGAVLGQHRNPDSNPPPNQPPTQAEPRDGDKARPREPARPAPRRPGQVVVVPAPGWPWGYPYPPYPHGYPPYGRVFTDWERSRVRLDVSPEDAEVFVDGYYAGVVDDYNGIFQRLTLHAGPHLVEIRKPGYRSLVIELNLYPGQTVTYRAKMEQSSDGEESRASAVPFAPGYEEGAVLPPVDEPSGDVKLDVSPDDAAIYADGFYVGIVDDFNGGQHLRLTLGRHHLVFVREGYQTLEVDLSVTREDMITYRASLTKS